MAYVSHEGDWHYRDPEDGKERSVEPDEELLDADKEFVVANEFAYVECRKVYTRNGERLEIRAPKRDGWIRLDPVELESLTWQTPELFSALLANGPEA